MTGPLSKLSALHVASTLGSLGSSLLVSSFTLSRWGLTEALRNVLPVLTLLLVSLFPVGFCLGTWVGRKWAGRKGVSASGRDDRPQRRLPTVIRHSRMADIVYAKISLVFWTASVAGLAVLAFGLSPARGVAVAVLLAAGFTAIQRATRG